jgi:integrase
MSKLQTYDPQKALSAVLSEDTSTIVRALIALSGRRAKHNYTSGRGTTQYVYKKSWVDFAAWLRYRRGVAPIDDWVFTGKDELFLLEWLEENLTGVDWKDVSRYQTDLLNRPVLDRRGRKKVGLEGSTVNGRIYALKFLYKIALRDGRVAYNPASKDYIDREKVSRAYRADEITADDARALLRALNEGDSYLAERNYLAVLMMVRMGLRRSELIGIESLDFVKSSEGMAVDVVRKGGKKEKLLVPTDIETQIRLYVQKWNLDGPLFRARGPEGQAMAPDDVTALVRELTQEVLGKPIGPHALRSTFITVALENGVALQEVQRYVGHADPKMTLAYDRARLGRQKAVLEGTRL